MKIISPRVFQQRSDGGNTGTDRDFGALSNQFSSQANLCSHLPRNNNSVAVM
jgi:hypothetical protein